MSNEQQAPLFYYMQTSDGHDVRHSSWIGEVHKREGWLPLYSEPPLRDLSDEEILRLWDEESSKPLADPHGPISEQIKASEIALTRAILAKAREKV